jgi:hypothetical protein
MRIIFETLLHGERQLLHRASYLMTLFQTAFGTTFYKSLLHTFGTAFGTTLRTTLRTTLCTLGMDIVTQNHYVVQMTVVGIQLGFGQAVQLQALAGFG